MAFPAPPPPPPLSLPQAATPVASAPSSEAETNHFARKIAPPLGKRVKRRADYPTGQMAAIDTLHRQHTLKAPNRHLASLKAGTDSAWRSGRWDCTQSTATSTANPPVIWIGTSWRPWISHLNAAPSAGSSVATMAAREAGM